jgi:O-methyltransferase
MIKHIYKQVAEMNLTYLADNKITSIGDCINEVNKLGISGDFVEFGVALGGSAICIAKEMGDGRSFVGLDVFDMIPPPGEKDGSLPAERYQVIKSGKSGGINGEKYYGYVNNLKEVVCSNFRQFGLEVDGEKISLVEGLYQETIPNLPEMSIAFCHIDCDWYDPVLLCMKYAAPRLSVGGYLVLDDYNDWPGCRKAVDEFLSMHDELEMIRTNPHAVIRRRV